MEECIFCKIINNEIKSEIVHSDKHVCAFKDIYPQAPVHILVVPNEHIMNINDAPSELIANCMDVVKELAIKEGIDQQGYRVVVNCNGYGGQVVGHLHIHLLGGRQMNWPPG